MTYRPDLTLDDFDDMLADAEGKPRATPKLTSYGPVNPNAAPISVPAYTPPPVAGPYHAPTYSPPLPVPAPYYYTADPMPRASALIHGVLFFTTGGIGNIFYQLHVMDKRNAWRRRHNM